MKFRDRLAHSWDAFRGRNPTKTDDTLYSSYRPIRRSYSSSSTKTTILAIKNRIAVDAAQYEIVHCDTRDGSYRDKRQSGLQYCLEVSANLDQTGREFLHDAFFSCLDEGTVAIVPTRTDIDPNENNSFKIESLRTARILEWYNHSVRVRMYDEETGNYTDRTYLKKFVSIIENPFAATMNSPNSTLSQLLKVMGQLDYVNELTSSGKLDLIIQLPYSLKSEGRKLQADRRREDIEMQLKSGKYGIAYIDSTEHITQLNRSLDNKLLDQVDKLESRLYTELGITPDILNGTAPESVMTNYYSRIIEPLVANFCDELKRKFLTKTAITQGQSILAFRDPFKLVPTSQIPELADKLTRNEIASSNEMRSKIGFKPVDNEAADELRNKNINKAEGQEFASTNEEANMYPAEDQMPIEGDYDAYNQQV